MQILRAEIIKSESELEACTMKSIDLEHQLIEHLRIAKQMQEQIDDSISHLRSVQNSNEELALRLRNAEAAAGGEHGFVAV